jgi:hypothetical protein
MFRWCISTFPSSFFLSMFRWCIGTFPSFFFFFFFFCALIESKRTSVITVRPREYDPASHARTTQTATQIVCPTRWNFISSVLARLDRPFNLLLPNLTTKYP